MKRLLLLLFVLAQWIGSANGQEVFTYHALGAPVILYRDSELTMPGAVLFPQYEEYLSAREYPEWMVGYIVQIIDEQESCFLLAFGGLFFYIKKGEVAINTRNYDGLDMLLFEHPDKSSRSFSIGTEERTLRIYGRYKGWLLTRLYIQGRIMEGWLPIEMACGNPFTPCC